MLRLEVVLLFRIYWVFQSSDDSSAFEYQLTDPSSDLTRPNKNTGAKVRDSSREQYTNKAYIPIHGDDTEQVGARGDTTRVSTDFDTMQAGLRDRGDDKTNVQSSKTESDHSNKSGSNTTAVSDTLKSTVSTTTSNRSSTVPIQYRDLRSVSMEMSDGGRQTQHSNADIQSVLDDEDNEFGVTML